MRREQLEKLLEGFIEGGLSKERPLIVDIDATGVELFDQENPY